MYFSVLNFCLLLPGVGEWTFRPLLGLALTVRLHGAPRGWMLCFPSPADTWRGRGRAGLQALFPQEGVRGSAPLCSLCAPVWG